MTVNVDLLKKTLAYVEANPKTHSQHGYRQGETMCFVSRAVVLDGAQWASKEPSTILLAPRRDDPSEVVLAGTVSIYDRATRVLGLDRDQYWRLSSVANTVDDLRRIVGELITSGGTR